MPEIQEYFLIWTYCKKGMTPNSKYYDFHKKFEEDFPFLLFQ